MPVEPLKKHRETSKRAPRIQEVIRGSIVIMARSCGKANCRCQKGAKHRSLYISQRHAGKTRMIYVPKSSEVLARRLIDNYRRIKMIMDEMSEANIRKLTKG